MSAPWTLTLPQLWAVVSVALPVVAVIGALGAVDLAYQIRAGDLMLHTRTVLRTDPFSFTVHGASWLNQQWGAEVLFALIFRALGWAGLALLHGALVSTVFGFVYLACRAAGGSVRGSAWLTLAAFAVSFANLALRPQLFGILLFSASLWILLRRRERPGRLWLLPVLFAGWANLHGSFPLGPLLVLLFWVEDAREDSALARRLVPVGLLAVLATLLNPFGLGAWRYVWSLTTNPVIRNLVTEWQPPSLRGYEGALFFLSVFVVGAVLARRGGPVPWPRLLRLALFFGLALLASRNVVWWALLVPTVLTDVTFPAGESRTDSPTHVNTAIAAFLLIFPVAFFPWGFVGARATAPGPRLSEAPAAISTRLAELLRPGDRVFVTQTWASWLEFALPKNPVFVDSRIELFPRSVWDQYFDISVGRQGWQAILDRWRVRAAVFSLGHGDQRLLIPLMRRDPRWVLAYQDRDGLIFLRRPA
jgi:hypothetical protein